MKMLGYFFFLLSFSLNASEYCPIQSQSELITKLAKEVEASCDWSIRELATRTIIKDCSKAQKKDSTIALRTQNGKKEIHFTQYGDTFNHRVPNIECKHSKAYQHRLNQLIKQLEHEAYTVRSTPPAPPKKKTAVAGTKRSGQVSSSQPTAKPPTKPAPRPAPKPTARATKKQLWSCRVPNYIRTYRIVDDQEKITLEEAYNTVCTKYN